MHRSQKETGPPAGSQRDAVSQATDHRQQGFKLLLFRIIAIMTVPVAFLLVLEMLLRIAGYGYPTPFLLQTKISGKRMMVQNDRFGWRFFGPERARLPETFAFEAEAPGNTIRIFVMGESAAWGDPQSEFGLPRMLDAMLSLRYPSVRFEVINVAMTGINSHAIREIARDCIPADGDIWVLYMGNNEVVGPFGSGTVFGSQTPPLAAIRAHLALKTTRIGQLLAAILAGMRPSEAANDSWGGMSMFLDQQVPGSDPRMERVYAYFQDNLEDIIECSRQAGAAMVVCNVAVNLRDCAPFASEIISITDKTLDRTWKILCMMGIELQNKGEWNSALMAYEKAEIINDRVAELHFRKGQCFLALNRFEAASSAFSQARDLDTLRFRFDSRMQQIVDTVVAMNQDPQIRFADAVAAFADASTNGIPGNGLFYEHVHLTWEGNWLLAKTVAEQLQVFLPEHVRNAADAAPAWPSPEQCARRLAWSDRERLQGLTQILKREQGPPFTLQLNHAERIADLENAIYQIQTSPDAPDLNDALAMVESAAESAPDDTYLLTRLANLRFKTGDAEGAIEVARRVAQLFPHAPSAWHQLASFYARSGRLDEAFEFIDRGLKLDPVDFWIRHDMARTFFREGKYRQAYRQWKLVIKQQPSFGPAYMGLGQILEKQGKMDAARKQYRMAVTHPVYLKDQLADLARLCVKQGWMNEAIPFFQQAITLSPKDAAIRYEFADALEQAGQTEESKTQRALARHSDTRAWVAHFQSGMELMQQDNLQEAAEQFREVIRLNPSLMEAHLNLAGTLLELGMEEEAAIEFNKVRSMKPDDPEVRRYLKSQGYGLDEAGHTPEL